MTLLANSVRALTKVNTVRPPVSGRFGALSANLMGAITRGNNLTAMEQSAWLFAVVDRISSAVASAEWQLFSRNQSGDDTEITSHPLLEVWNSPNPFYTTDELLEVSGQHFELAGEMWWVLLRSGNTVREIWPVRPDRMAPVPDRKDHISGYVYSVGSEKIPLEVEDVIFVRRPSPTDPYRGIGVVGALMPDLQADWNAAKWNNQHFANNAEPGGIIELEEELSDDEFMRFTERWKSTHQGVSNAGKVAILERAKWTDRKISHRDMQFEQLRKLSRDNILGAFGVPKSVLGITEDVNRANAEAGDVMFAKWVVLPRLRRIRSTINAQLAPLFGDNLFLDFVDPVPENAELDLTRAKEAVTKYKGKVVTRNEARAILELPEVPDGDEFDASGGVPPQLMSPGEPEERRVKQNDPLLPSPVERAEDEMRSEWSRRLETEVDGLVSHLEQTKSFLPRWKIEPGDIDSYDWNWEARYLQPVIEEIARVFTIAALEAEPLLAPGMAQTFASRYAEAHAGDLIRGVTETTRKRVRELVTQTVESGESLNTLQKNLRGDYVFSRDRARVIARTETATALGEGAKDAAVSQGRDEKRWDTQSDPNVDAVCASNEAQGWIKIGDPFQSGHDKIPAHPSCRCVTRYRTARLVEESVNSHRIHTNGAGESAIFCPQCSRRLPANNGKQRLNGGEIYCKRCDSVWELKDGEAVIPAHSANDAVTNGAGV